MPSPEELLREAQSLLAARRPAEARAAFEALVALQPGNASLHHGLALALKAAGDTEAAGNAFAAALAIRPDYWEAAFNLGVLLDEGGEAPLAERAYRMALSAKPDAVRVLSNLGNLLRRGGRLAEGEALLRRALQAAPSDASALGNLALARIDAGDFAEARKLAERAAALAPQETLWWEAAGTAARLLSDASGAIAPLEHARTLAPGDAGVHFELALALEANADDDRALESFSLARRLAPAWERLRWAEALHLPAIVDDNAHADAALQRFDHGLAELEQTLRLESAAGIADALDAALGVIPFNLHYLPGEHRERQARFAKVVARVARAAIPIPQRAAPAGKIRVGFVSENLRTHVVARFFAAFVTGLDPARFERWVWHTGSTRDAVTDGIANAVEHFDSRSNAREIVSAIRAAAIDVLVYPDIGLDPLQGVLAALRLAPVQAALYGHPVSTGLDTIDAFLSGEALEPDGAQASYTERLVCLPGLGAMPSAPVARGDATWARALRATGPLLLCAQNLMKLPPSFDDALARIAVRTNATLVFFDRGPGVTRRFEARLARELARQGGDARAQLKFVAALPYPEFLAGLAEADLVLDSPGFSGGATSLDALGVGAVVLAIEGAQARGRQTSAMLRRLESPELIARDADDYVARACGLLGHRARLSGLRERIGERANRLFGDRRPLAAFAEYLEARGLESRGKTPT